MLKTDGVVLKKKECDPPMLYILMCFRFGTRIVIQCFSTLAILQDVILKLTILNYEILTIFPVFL